MSSFLDLTEENLDNAVEPKAVDDGEYTLKITDWKTDDKGSVVKENQNGNPFIMPVLEIVECAEAEYAKAITKYLPLPHPDMTKKERNAARYNLRMFWEAFGVDYTQRIIYEDVIGLTAEALLSVSADSGYGEQNNIDRFLPSH